MNDFLTELILVTELTYHVHRNIPIKFQINLKLLSNLLISTQTNVVYTCKYMKL